MNNENGVTFTALRLAAGMSREQATQFLGVRDDTVKHWTSGRRPVPDGVTKLLLGLVHRQEREAEALAPSLNLANVESYFVTSDEEAQAKGWPLAIPYNVMVARAWAMRAMA
jgi:DNA-binding XRE family transcriptional regulator